MTSTLLPSSAEMQQFERITITAKGISAVELMDRAGSLMSERILTHYSSLLNEQAASVAILCGPGNNGGDGMVVARDLHKHGIRVTVLVVDPPKRSKVSQVQLDDLLKKVGKSESFDLQIINTPSVDEALERRILQSTLIVDALLGIGAHGAPRGPVADLIDICKRASAPIVSLDVPSGIDCDSGQCAQSSISATYTLTVDFIKRGMLQFPARSQCGVIEIIEIGILGTQTPFSILNRNTAPRLPARTGDAHKHDFGSILVIGGSASMMGAPILSATAALVSGAGLIVAALPDLHIAPTVPPELIVRRWPAQGESFSKDGVANFKEATESFSHFLIGPGMGQSPASMELLSSVLDYSLQSKKFVLVDADGLNNLALAPRMLSSEIVITPHPGEAARLLRVSTKQVQSNRYEAAESLHKHFGCTVVLKGASTIVYSSYGAIVCPAGTPYMATPGSGDVLAGLICALNAQGLDSYASARLGVLIHALAGERAHSISGGPILASAIVGQLSALVGEFTI